MSWSGRSLVAGSARAEVVYADVPLSFMGGADPATGRVIDTHHPLHRTSIAGKVLAIPSGRGSCSGSATLLEMLLGGTAPAALVFEHHESILALGVVIAEELFGISIPVVQLAPRDFRQLARVGAVTVVDGAISAGGLKTDIQIWPEPRHAAISGSPPHLDVDFQARPDAASAELRLSELDERFLAGEFGEAARVAMRIVVRAAILEGADQLIDVEMAHLDGVFYQGPASLRFATTLRDLGARVRIPASMNAICVDRRRWRGLGVPDSLGEPSDELADAYAAMGATPTYTCAPYCLSRRPRAGQSIAWAESNAVAYANSVIGAKTMKYPDYLDLLVAITGRAPNVSTYRASERLATVQVDVEPFADIDDCFWPVLGYLTGLLSPHDIPVLTGLEPAAVTSDNLKAFSAAFATSSAAPMFHVVGLTPEAPTVAAALGGNDPVRRHRVGAPELRGAWRELNSAENPQVDLVAIGNPHLSLTELARLADLCQAALRAGRQRSPQVAMVVTCGREVYEAAAGAGSLAPIERFGATVLTDTCWCFITEPVVPPGARTILTNSGKYAHYGPAVTGRGFHLRSLAGCIAAATTGQVELTEPRWRSQGSVASGGWVS